MAITKRNYAREVGSGSWEDQFSVAAADAANLISVHSTNVEDGSGATRLVVDAVYNGSGAITLENYNGFPIGSIIRDLQAFKLHLKTGATTWKSSAALT